MQPIHNIILLFGLGVSVFLGAVIGYTYHTPKPVVPLKVKAKGYTLFEKGRGIDENGDTIIVKPIFK
jgi:hypothetical protein